VRSDVSSDELLASYRAAHLLVHPALDAVANNALGEAMGCGLPIVATRVGAVPEYLDAACGALTPPGDAEAMAGAILELAGDPRRRARMGAAARRRALELDWRRIAERTLDVYAAARRGREAALPAR
jgi:glycosyltransferase involved in cell wall biosynthesis